MPDKPLKIDDLLNTEQQRDRQDLQKEYKEFFYPLVKAADFSKTLSTRQTLYKKKISQNLILYNCGKGDGTEYESNPQKYYRHVIRELNIALSDIENVFLSKRQIYELSRIFKFSLDCKGPFPKSTSDPLPEINSEDLQSNLEKAQNIIEALEENDEYKSHCENRFAWTHGMFVDKSDFTATVKLQHDKTQDIRAEFAEYIYTKSPKLKHTFQEPQIKLCESYLKMSALKDAMTERIQELEAKKQPSESLYATYLSAEYASTSSMQID